MVLKFLEEIRDSKNRINISKYISKVKEYDEELIYWIPYVFTNLKDIKEFSKASAVAFNLDEEKTVFLSVLIYLYKEKIDEDLIQKFISFENFDKNLVLNIVNNKKKQEYFKEKREKEKAYVNEFMKNIDFFEQEEIVKWLATNNRKTKEFYADYGLEVNELIKFIKSDLIMDYDFKKTISALKINSFEEEMDKLNILSAKAILSSIVFRERFGVGTLSRAINDLIVVKCLKYIEKYFNTF